MSPEDRDTATRFKKTNRERREEAEMEAVWESSLAALVAPFNFTQNSQLGRVVLRSGRVLGRAAVSAAVRGRNRFDLQDAGPRTQFGRRDARHAGRRFSDPVKRPADVHRQIALVDGATDLNVRARRVFVVVAERESRYFRRH